MHPDVAALLAVQDDDVIIDDLETRLAELRPRLDAMAAEHDRRRRRPASRHGRPRNPRSDGGRTWRRAWRSIGALAGQESDGVE